ncbi:ABC transporter substrate-binding protein [Candidatus Pelagibacter sp.]|nr:ABC transporter substrate-binding protein [Candidatus Pelagibacter sp.]
MFKIFRIFIIFLIFILKSTFVNAQEEKIKIGLLVPMSGENMQLGKLLIKSTKLALTDIVDNKIEIYPRDSGSDPSKTLQSAIELKKLGVKIIIGPIFFKNLEYLNEINDVIFLSLTNKTENLPRNVISSGVNSVSQLNAIKKFIKSNKLKKTIFLTPDLEYKSEIKKAIKQSEIKIFKHYIYDTEPTKLTKQIEDITNYKIRKQNLIDEITRVEKSDLNEDVKERRINKLKKRYTIGNVKFDSVIISDFDESLKSVITSLLYTDVSPKDKNFIVFNQWFDDSLQNEKTLQPLYYPSINKKNLEKFNEKFFKTYNETPNHLALLSYDLVGLIYYLSLKMDLSQTNNLFKKENSFKGKIGIFDIKNNKINHRLNLYEIKDGSIKEIF